MILDKVGWEFTKITMQENPCFSQKGGMKKVVVHISYTECFQVLAEPNQNGYNNIIR